MKRVLFSIVMLLAAGFSFAQEKDVKQAKSLAEDVKPNFTEAEKLINGALENAETKNQANTWNVAGLIQKRINEKEIEKAYLRQPYDTLKSYNSLYKMFGYFLKCDELEKTPNEKGKVKFKYRKDNAATILTERVNLINGGSQYYNLGKNKEALDYFGMYVDLASAPMLEKEQIASKDTLLSTVAFYACLAASRMNDYPNAIKYGLIAKKDKQSGKDAMQLIADAYKAQKDTANWVQTLKDGILAYPNDNYFFGHLVDYYSNANKLNDAMAFADQMLAKDPKNSFYLYVKGYLCQSMKNYDQAIEFYKKTIEVDPKYAEAYSNMGLVYWTQALDYASKVDFNSPKFKAEQAKINKFYESAKPCYEKARELKPDNKELWLNGLYTVYYKLGIGGAEFDELAKEVEALGK
ncbi:tetratricopeptide repeat protein [uncultured Bacteroides sp.]|uniref:tetratricopeptide repeat protein n=1 Tax=uncultured Bacteroides sp. TaxID=162156 RepID=UPI002AAB3BEB|nr:tetratricopeptide repeat protein [uncultured Bacteroides sp.]